MLLVGRMLAMGINFTVQVLTVRYLAKSAYGAFAYALSVVSLSSSISLLGLDKAVARFVPIYQEQEDYGRMFGAILLALGTALGIGLSIILFFFGARNILATRYMSEPLLISLLLIVIALAPLQALDSLFENLLAVFAGARAIFFRRHLMGPGLRLAAVLLVMVSRSNVYLLAAGYLAGGALGTCLFGLLFFQVVRRQKLLQHWRGRRVIIPVREILRFSMPLLTTDAALILRSSLVVVLLQAMAGTVAVAEFRAVLPLADVNLLVFQSFRYLFTPLAARLYARQDQPGLNDLYWKTAVWITVFSFPVFAATFALARPVTLFIFGERYASSANVLAILAAGSYLNAALGFNYHTLSVYGRVRYLVITDVTSALFGLALNLLLIPSYGALGAAISVSAALLANNLLNHAGMLRSTGIDLFQPRYLRVYATIVGALAVLLLAQFFLHPPLILGVALTALVAVLLIRLNRGVMEVGETFPELARLPVARWLFVG